jgi:hypothetical protein
MVHNNRHEIVMPSLKKACLYNALPQRVLLASIKVASECHQRTIAQTKEIPLDDLVSRSSHVLPVMPTWKFPVETPTTLDLLLAPQNRVVLWTGDPPFSSRFV